MARGNPWADHYTRRAREEKWLARSVYKLEEIDRKYRIISKGGRLLDLGCSPGSWSQYGIKKAGPGGLVIGVDLTVPGRLQAPNFKFLQADVFRLDEAQLLGEFGRMDAVLSDMAPKTSGIPSADVAGSVRLAEKALNLALSLLKENGHFVCKVFQGNDFKPLTDECGRYFQRMKTLRPSAVRKGSREMYLIGLKFTGSS